MDEKRNGIQILNEQTLGLEAAGRRLPYGPRGLPTHRGTLCRWISRGTRSPDGGRVKLEAVRVGGRWVTSVEAIARFVEATTPTTTKADPIRTLSQRRRATELAVAELEAAGC